MDHIDLDQQALPKKITTMAALYDPQPGDVFRYRDLTRWIVVANRTQSTLSVMFFNRRMISGPFDRIEYRVTTHDEFMKAFLSDAGSVDPSSSLQSRITLRSRGLLVVNADYMCATCPVYESRLGVLGTGGTRQWLKKMGWIK